MNEGCMSEPNANVGSNTLENSVSEEKNFRKRFLKLGRKSRFEESSQS